MHIGLTELSDAPLSFHSLGLNYLNSKVHLIKFYFGYKNKNLKFKKIKKYLLKEHKYLSIDKKNQSK